MFSMRHMYTATATEKDVTSSFNFPLETFTWETSVKHEVYDVKRKGSHCAYVCSITLRKVPTLGGGGIK